MVLGVVRPDGEHLGVPTRDTWLHVGDMLVRYGRAGRLAELDARRGETGDESRRMPSSGRARAARLRSSERPVDADAPWDRVRYAIELDGMASSSFAHLHQGSSFVGFTFSLRSSSGSSSLYTSRPRLVSPT